jgi:hypothetical protein
MKSYIFLTTEGHTFQPGTDSMGPDIENAQVIGFASGLNEEDAFKNLLETDNYLLKTKFNEVFCYPLMDNYTNSQKYFYLSENRTE